jgi:hypothetical protein
MLGGKQVTSYPLRYLLGGFEYLDRALNYLCNIKFDCRADTHEVLKLYILPKLALSKIMSCLVLYFKQLLPVMIWLDAHDLCM